MRGTRIIIVEVGKKKKNKFNCTIAQKSAYKILCFYIKNIISVLNIYDVLTVMFPI